MSDCCCCGCYVYEAAAAAADAVLLLHLQRRRWRAIRQPHLWRRMRRRRWRRLSCHLLKSPPTRPPRHFDATDTTLDPKGRLKREAYTKHLMIHIWCFLFYICLTVLLLSGETHELAALPLNGGYTVDGKIRYTCGLKMSGSAAWDHTRSPWVHPWHHGFSRLFLYVFDGACDSSPLKTTLNLDWQWNSRSSVVGCCFSLGTEAPRYRVCAVCMALVLHSLVLH